MKEESKFYLCIGYQLGLRLADMVAGGQLLSDRRRRKGKIAEYLEDIANGDLTPIPSDAEIGMSPKYEGRNVDQALFQLAAQIVMEAYSPPDL